MKVVIAIDSFKGSMTSLEAGESAAAGIRRVYPDADIRIRPLADHISLSLDCKFLDFLIVKLNFGTGAWACLDTRAARLRLAADKPTHKLKSTT